MGTEPEHIQLLRQLISEVRKVRTDLLDAVSDAAGQIESIGRSAQTLLDSWQGGQDAGVTSLPRRRLRGLDGDGGDDGA